MKDFEDFDLDINKVEENREEINERTITTVGTVPYSKVVANCVSLNCSPSDMTACRNGGNRC